MEGPAGEIGTVAANAAIWGDIILARKEMPTSYHLAVVVDDAAQNVTDVVRGRDLFYATAVHRLLQTLLGCPSPDTIITVSSSMRRRKAFEIDSVYRSARASRERRDAGRRSVGWPASIEPRIRGIVGSGRGKMAKRKGKVRRAGGRCAIARAPGAGRAGARD